MHEKNCRCQILEVEGKFVSGPGDIFIYWLILFIYLFIYLFIICLFIYFIIHLFIYCVMVKELLQKVKNNKLLKHLIKISLMSIKS